MIFNIKNNKGVVALLSVVIIAMVSLLLLRSSSVIALIDLDMVNNSIHSSMAMSNAESCLEDALRQIQLDANFRSDGFYLDLNNGNCLCTVTSEQTNRYLIRAEGRVLSYLKIIEAEASLDNGELTIDLWERK